MTRSRLQAQAAAALVLNAAGRIVRENDPDHAPGPLLFLSGCAEGNVCCVRRDLPEAVAGRLLALAADEPAWGDPAHPPACLPALLDGLAALGLEPTVSLEILYALPAAPRLEPGVRVIRSGTVEGAELLARMAREGLPAHLAAAGFVGLADFWAPWCVAVAGGEIAAIGFAARLGEAAADIGVYTFPGYRGRGLGAAVTAAWSRHPDLGDRLRFHTTRVDNLSSQRVAARLGLPRIGAVLRIGG